MKSSAVVGGYYVHAEGRRYVVECFRAGTRHEAATILAAESTLEAHVNARALAQDIADKLNKKTEGLQ